MPGRRFERVANARKGPSDTSIAVVEGACARARIRYTSRSTAVTLVNVLPKSISKARLSMRPTSRPLAAEMRIRSDIPGHRPACLEPGMQAVAEPQPRHQHEVIPRAGNML
jgi:hypothetical protein